MDIRFSIISRGTMIVNYGEKTIKIQGELTFTPPVFYANIKSIIKWEKPFESISIKVNEKKEIIEYITSVSEKQIKEI
jgi:hypothetical protein